MQGHWSVTAAVVEEELRSYPQKQQYHNVEELKHSKVTLNYPTVHTISTTLNIYTLMHQLY